MFVLIYYMTRYEGISYDDAANVIGKTLGEEKQADLLLTQIGEKHVNYHASLEPGKHKTVLKFKSAEDI
jgi:hypothetical protein